MIGQLNIGWVVIESLEDLKGPLVFFTLSEDQVLTVSEEGVIGICAIDEPLEKFEPEDVSQVIVGKFLLPGVFCLQTAYKKYLSTDEIGKVSAKKEAIGATEKWNPEYLGSGKVAFKSAFGCYLSFDGQLRADSKEVGEQESFTLKCQAVERWLRLKEERAKKKLRTDDVKDLELDELSKHHTFESKRELEEAQKEGRLREALLDQRIKKKHDKFC